MGVQLAALGVAMGNAVPELLAGRLGFPSQPWQMFATHFAMLWNT